MSDLSDLSPETQRILSEVSQKEASAREESLRSSAIDSSLLEALSVGVIVVDSHGAIVRVNKAAELLFGYPRKELLGQLLEILVPDSSKEGHPQHRHSYDSNPLVRPMGIGLNVKGRRKSGAEFPVSITLSQFATVFDTYTLATIATPSASK